MGSDGSKNPTFVGTGLTNEERRELLDLLKDYKDCFAWSYEEMSSLTPNVALHQLEIREDAKVV